MNELLLNIPPLEKTRLSLGEKYDLGSIKVWVENGIVTQVAVYSEYRGMLESAIHIGSTIAEVEAFFGYSVEEDEDDNLIVPGSSGWCFETEHWREPQVAWNNRNTRIVAIFVFNPDRVAMRSASEAGDRCPKRPT